MKCISGIARLQLSRLFLSVLCVCDGLLSTILVLRLGDGLKYVPHNFTIQIFNYNFGTSSFDLWLTALLRSFLYCLLCLSFCCIPRTPLLSRLKCLSPLSIIISTVLICLLAAKLLASFEFYPDGTAVHGIDNPHDINSTLCQNSSTVPCVIQPGIPMIPLHPWLWGLIGWMVVSQILYAIIYQAMMTAKIVPPPRTSNNPARSMSINNSVQRSEITPLLVDHECANLSESEVELNPESKSGEQPKISEQESRKMSAIVIFWRIAKYYKYDLHLFITAFIFLVISSVATALVPYYIGEVVNHIAIQPSVAEFEHAILIMSIIAVVSAISAGIRGSFLTIANSRVNIRLRKELFRSIVDQEIGFFDKVETGDLTSRLTSDTTKVADQIGLNTNILLRSLVTFLVSLVFMFRLTWKLSIVTLLGIPLATIVTKYFGEMLKNNGKDVQDSFAKANTVAEEVISSMRTVRSFANERNEVERFGIKLKHTLGEFLKQGKIYGAWMMITNLMELAIQVVTLYYGGHLVMYKEITGGQLVSLLIYQTSITADLDAMGSVFTDVMVAFGAAEKVFELIDREPNVDHKGGDFEPLELDGLVEFRNVSFCYPTRDDMPVLNDVSFMAEPGEVVALVGPSGSGKSTCIALLERFYDPSSGNVLLDGRDVADYRHSYLHSKVSLVGQEPVLYACSVGGNIAYGIEDITQASIEHTARLANAHTFISSMTKGYETATGEKGTQLSGGQKQRVAIARALIRKPTVLLLDEATSALDAESEYLVQQAINQNLHGKTVIIVAHRLSTVEKADRIVVLDKGCVQEQGSHQQLLEKEGLYARLVRKQIMLDET